MGYRFTPAEGQTSEGNIMKTQKEVHQIISDIIERSPPNIQADLEEALSPLECRVIVEPTYTPNSKVEIFYRLPTDAPATFRHIELEMGLR